MKPYIIGYTTGVFDLFHIGHVNILKRAKAQCDYLIVGVSTDEIVEEYKGKKPIIKFQDRIAIVEACRYVDKVIPQSTMSKIEAWHNLHFDVMFHGKDWQGSKLYTKYEEELASVGAKIIYLTPTEGISTTKIIKQISDK